MATYLHSGWYKYYRNPVVGGGEAGSCFDVSAVKLQDGMRLYVSWREKHCIGASDSQDGLHFTPLRPVMQIDENIPGEDEINRPCVIEKDGKWLMWFTSQHRPGISDGTSCLYMAESDDGLSWRRLPGPVMQAEKPWEKAAVMCPHVLWDAEKACFRMWYSAGDQYEPDAIGYAESGDGLHWEKLPAPIFMADPAHPSECHKVTACCVIPHEGWHYMFYVGFRNEDDATIHLARSRDGIAGWQRFDKNPIVWPKPWGRGFDRDACYKPSVLPMGDGWMMWYNGRFGIAESIGAVMHPGFDLGFGPDEE